ncbi:MAG: alanine racemase, partial [Candidatus Hodarchaeota archaeon]
KVNGVTVTAMVDSREHLELLESHAAGKNVNLHVLVELDVSDWFLGQKVGAMRSPLNKPEHVVEVAKMVDEYPHLSFRGIMGYEGQCASIDDKSAFMRWIKKRSRRLVNELRQATVDALVDAGLKPEVVDGGGSGCHQDTAAEECVTEVAIGSLLFKPHIFDGFKSLEDFQPSMYFALQVVRQPQDDVVTAFSGGYISSGVQARPIPWFPKGLKAIPREGFGEVQTPFKHDPKQVKIGVGDHVLCRFGKAGEPLEHFNEVNVYEGGNFVEKLKTYRGEGKKFH